MFCCCVFHTTWTTTGMRVTPVLAEIIAPVVYARARVSIAERAAAYAGSSFRSLRCSTCAPQVRTMGCACCKDIHPSFHCEPSCCIVRDANGQDQSMLPLAPGDTMHRNREM